MTDEDLRGTLILQREGLPRMGGERIRLLRAIGGQGSISGAARAVGLSCKAAWDAVAAMNNLFATPLVSAAPGGKAGGGATITPAGQRVISTFAAVEAGLARVVTVLSPMTFRPNTLRTALAATLATALLAVPARAGETLAAVAANFTEPATEIAAAFTAATGHTVTFSFGPAGQFYTQIAQGAPFEVFLSADQARPEKAEAEGLAVPGTRFTYAIGTLVLWSADPALIDGTGAVLRRPDLAHVAIADPAAAPYGAAAVETMQALGLHDSLEPKLVIGKSISQAHQFVATGNAPVGFVALSQVIAEDKGSRWLVPPELHAPIRQDAVLLKTGETSEAARAFLDFLRTPEARAIIERYGYALED